MHWFREVCCNVQRSGLPQEGHGQQQESQACHIPHTANHEGNLTHSGVIMYSNIVTVHVYIYICLHVPAKVTLCSPTCCRTCMGNASSLWGHIQLRTWLMTTLRLRFHISLQNTAIETNSSVLQYCTPACHPPAVVLSVDVTSLP